MQAHGTSVRRARETAAYSFFPSKQRSARASEDRGSKNSMLRHFGGIRIQFESFGGKCARFIAGVNNHWLSIRRDGSTGSPMRLDWS